jgi:cytochrome c553
MALIWRPILAASAAALTCGVSAAPEVPLQHPLWAYNVSVSQPPAQPIDLSERLTLPETGKSFTRAQVLGGFPDLAPESVADWFPNDHPTMPKLVAQGDMGSGGRNILPCARCHFPNGRGLPENAPVAGQPKDYLIATLMDMRAGLRASSEPRKRNATAMVAYAKAMSPAEIEEVATYYASIPWRAWVQVRTALTVPQTENRNGLSLVVPGGKWEPIGNRIVETPVDRNRTEVLRDPHSPIIAYVPPGSLQRGRLLVTKGGGKTTHCATCHGPDLRGGGTIPAINARQPSYIARQLNDFRQGSRNGHAAALMQPVVARLEDDDITAIAAYLASIQP